MAMAMPMLSPALRSSLTNSSSTRKNLFYKPSFSNRKSVHRVIIVAAAESEKKNKNKGEDEGFSPFKFVTDNPSSRNAIQLPIIPTEDGTVGEMLYRIENKGRDYGSYVKVGDFKWFVRETGSSDTKLGTIVFIHGAPTQSFSYRVVMAQMADVGYHCYAPDWLGFGFSQKPQPGYDFAYTEEAFHEEFEKLLIDLGIDSPFFMVTQGFLMGSYGLTWALKNPSKIKKLAILNSPLTPSASASIDPHAKTMETSAEDGKNCEDGKNSDKPSQVQSKQDQENFALRRLEASDYTKGFLDLLGQLTVCGNASQQEFSNRFQELQDLGNDHFVCVIEDLNRGRIVATGTVFVEKKFIRSCGKAGHIEDVVVDSSVRGKHLGHKVVKFLTEHAKFAGCYKVILDCSVENKGFYEKCGFKSKNVQMTLYL